MSKKELQCRNTGTHGFRDLATKKKKKEKEKKKKRKTKKRKENENENERKWIKDERTFGPEARDK